MFQKECAKKKSIYKKNELKYLLQKQYSVLSPSVYAYVFVCVCEWRGLIKNKHILIFVDCMVLIGQKITGKYTFPSHIKKKLILIYIYAKSDL